MIHTLTSHGHISSVMSNLGPVGIHYPETENNSLE